MPGPTKPSPRPSLRLAWGLAAGLLPSCLGAQEAAVVSLHEFVSTEVRHQGFTLPRAMKVHVRATGGGTGGEERWMGDRFPFAYGWILNASTREVVWQMDYANAPRDGRYRVADLRLDLPQGSYEAYFSNHAFGVNSLFTHWSRNIDRRHLEEDFDDHENHVGHGEGVHGWLRGLFRSFGYPDLERWKDQAGHFGMDILVPGAAASEVRVFTAPLLWKNVLLSLTKTGDEGEWSQAFRLKKPATLHVYAQGEGSRRALVDTGWILDVRTRRRVWEMDPAKAQYAGGVEKNKRQVETLVLPAGDYVATYVTDGSHSPADWNGAPPCDPLLYGLTLALPKDEDVAQASLTEARNPGAPLAELVRVGNGKDLRASFTLGTSRALRVYGLGEAEGDEWADFGWIEDAQGKRVWEMRLKESHPAGGDSKNRMVDEAITLPKGAYTLRYRSDDSHAYGHWNERPPRDKEHYGLTVWAW